MDLKIDRDDLMKVWRQLGRFAVYEDLKDLSDRTTTVVAHIE